MNKNINVRIGVNVRQARRRACMSAQKVVTELQQPITYQQFYSYESGGARWPVDLLIETSLILKTDIKNLLEGTCLKHHFEP